MYPNKNDSKCNLCSYFSPISEEMETHLKIPKKELNLPIGSTFNYENHFIGFRVKKDYSDWREDHTEIAKFAFIENLFQGYAHYVFELTYFFDSMRKGLNIGKSFDPSDSNWKRISNSQKDIFNFLFGEKGFKEFSNDEWKIVQEKLSRAKLKLSKSFLIQGKIPEIKDLHI